MPDAAEATPPAAPVRTGQLPGRARISSPRDAAPVTAPAAAPVPEPVVDAPATAAAAEPAPAPAAPKVEPAAPAAPSRGQPPGRARIAARVVTPPAPAPVEVEVVPEPEPEPVAEVAESEPTPEPPAPVVPAPASASRGPAPGRARLSAPPVAAKPVAQVVRPTEPTLTRWREATTGSLADLPPEPEAVDDEDDEGDEDEDMVIGEPDPVHVAPSPVPEPIPSWTMVTFRHTNLVAHYRYPDRIGPVLPMEPDKAFVGPKGFADDRDVPF